MKNVSSIALAILCLSLCLALDYGLEAFSDYAKGGSVPILCTVFDSVAPLFVVSIFIGVVVGMIWRGDAEARSVPFEIVVAVIALLLSAVVLMGVVAVMRHFTSLNGYRDIPWYRYISNVFMLIALGYAMWRNIIKCQKTDMKGA